MSKASGFNHLQYIVERAAELARAGVRYLEVGEGAQRVRIEFTTAPGSDLLPDQTPAKVQGSATGASEEGVDHERADESPAQGAPDGARELAADDLDLAHLDDAD